MNIEQLKAYLQNPNIALDNLSDAMTISDGDKVESARRSLMIGSDKEPTNEEILAEVASMEKALEDASGFVGGGISTIVNKMPGLRGVFKKATDTKPNPKIKSSFEKSLSGNEAPQDPAIGKALQEIAEEFKNPRQQMPDIKERKSLEQYLNPKFNYIDGPTPQSIGPTPLTNPTKEQIESAEELTSAIVSPKIDAPSNSLKALRTKNLLKLSGKK